MMKNPGAHRSGFTLVETVLSLAIASIILGAMGSLIVVASRSIPERKRATDYTLAAAAVLEQLTADLLAAQSINLADKRAIEVAVADRDGDGKPESIRYEWSGVAGEALGRYYNNQPATLAPSVSNFELRYNSTTSTLATPDTVFTTPEALVATWTGGLLYSERSLNDSNEFIGQNIQPSFGSATRTWTITRVQLWTKRSGLANGVNRVQLRTVGSDRRPTASVLAEALVNEVALSANFSLNQAVFSGAPAMLPNEEIAVVIGCSANCTSAIVGYSGLTLLRATPMVTGSGTTWSRNGLAVIPHNVWATTTESIPTAPATKRLTEVVVVIQLGVGAEVRITVALPNTPEVS